MIIGLEDRDIERRASASGSVGNFWAVGVAILESGFGVPDLDLS